MPSSQHPDTPAEVAVPRLSVRASKTFGRVRVLDKVALDVLPGEIHGLVGQNGSGKSTLIKLLSGFYPADAGTTIAIDGVELKLPISPLELQARGVAFVHQDLGLDGSASVIENIRVGRFDASPITRRIRWKSEAASVTKTLSTLGAGSINPYALVSTLTHAERASVAIARAIQGIEKGTGCIVFDESTQSLPRDILHEFYAKVRALAASGTSVLLVSHRLDEVLALCDRVTVLEDGRATVLGQPTEGLSEAALTRLILGNSSVSSATANEPKSANAVQDRVLLDASGLIGNHLRDASITLRAGEVVGLIGTSESGYDELPYVLSGASTAQAGTVRIGGSVLSANRLNPSTAIAAGLCFVPGNRGGEGLATELLALENISLPRLRRKAHPLSLRRRWQLDEFASAVTSLGLTPANPDLTIASFSGGNQQKLLLAKWLLNDPQVLVLHEPTQAVDVGARAEILRAIRVRAAQGVAVLVSSLETQDLATVCDRVLVIKDGRVVRELSGAELEPHTIIDAVYAGISTEIAHVAA